MVAVLLVSLLFIATSLVEAQQFTCNFQMRTPSMISGYVNGVLYYDWTGAKMENYFTTSTNREYYQYAGGNGYTSNKNQFYFEWSDTCSCSISTLTTTQPALFASSTYWSGSGSSLTATSLGASSNIKSMTLGSDGFPTKATFADGTVYTYSSCRTGVDSSKFTTPDTCNCGAPLDIVLVLDRSSSISIANGNLEKSFTQSFVAGFNYGPSAVNLGITNFHALSWDGPVSLAQGNSLSSVTAGANAIQCWDPVLGPKGQGQCISAQGATASWAGSSCCGSGTSITAGLVNGADMLAAQIPVEKGTIRESAGKVIVLFTDGYHNSVLDFDAQGNLKRDSKGKPYGIGLSINGKFCSEAGEAACVDTLNADLTYAVNYAQNKVPGVKIFVVGIGNVVKKEQLAIIAQGNLNQVLVNSDWNQLQSLVTPLLAETCSASADASSCAGCCGFCSCNGCVAPDGCDNPNLCASTSLKGTCCSTQNLITPPAECVNPNKCNKYGCDSKANGGAGGCTSTPVPVAANTTCAGYTCDPTSGNQVYTNLCPCKIACQSDSDCAGSQTQCNSVSCYVDAAKPCNNKCVITDTSATCQKGDKCFTDSCDPVKGCQHVANPLPAENSCASYTCLDGATITTFKQACIICTATNQTLCDDKNACTDDSCVVDPSGDPTKNQCKNTPKAADFCTAGKTDACEIWTCDPAQGCVYVNKTVPTSDECSLYECNHSTGDIEYTNLFCSPPACMVDSDCNDNNACTVDVCYWPDHKQNKTAQCNYTTITDAQCDDGNSCTVDTCNTTIGCQSVALPVDFCNDNNNCTIDTCDVHSTNTSFPCVYTPVNCTKKDVCFNAVCDVVQGCLQVPIVCPTTDNCTVSGCNATKYGGCYIVSAGTCSAGVAGLTAGIAAGLVAGIVVAAVAGALTVGGGAAMAFTQGAGSGLGAVVAHSPIYQPDGNFGNNPLHAAHRA